MRRAAPLLLVAALLVLASAAAAQRRGHQDDDWGRRSPTRVFAGGAFVYGNPQGEFSDYVDHAFGGSGHLLVRLAGPLALRLEGNGLRYGSETRTVPLSPTLGGRILVDLETSNDLLFVGLGPQLALPDGRLRPYVNGLVGVNYLATQSYIRGTDDPGERFGDTRHFDDASFTYGAGAGVYIPVSRGRTPIALDVGAQFRRGGRTEYLVEGSVQDNPDGSLSFDPIRSDTDLVTFHVGVSVGVGRDRDHDHDDNDDGRDRRRRRRR